MSYAVMQKCMEQICRWLDILALQLVHLTHNFHEHYVSKVACIEAPPHSKTHQTLQCNALSKL